MMYKIAALLLLVQSVVGQYPSYVGPALKKHSTTPSRKGETLKFEDDFNNFDLSLWKHEITMGGGGNWEFEWYTNNRTNSYVKDGVLYLKPTMTADTIGENQMTGVIPYTMDIYGSQPADLCTSEAWYGCFRVSNTANILNPIQSARLRTADTLYFTYGRLEVRAKLPKGDWIWPAIWMLPQFQDYGQWPVSGEIDIMESRGNSPSCSAGGYNSVSSTLHWGPFYGQDKYTLTTETYTLSGSDFASDFHTFGLYWNSDQLYTYIDDDSNRVLQVTFDESFWTRGGFDTTSFNNPWVGETAYSTPFNKPFYLIFDLAVGGVSGFFPDGQCSKPWADTSSIAYLQFWQGKGQWYPTWNGDDVAMQIDSVKLWSFE